MGSVEPSGVGPRLAQPTRAGAGEARDLQKKRRPGSRSETSPRRPKTTANDGFAANRAVDSSLFPLGDASSWSRRDRIASEELDDGFRHGAASRHGTPSRGRLLVETGMVVHDLPSAAASADPRDPIAPVAFRGGDEMDRIGNYSWGSRRNALATVGARRPRPEQRRPQIRPRAEGWTDQSSEGSRIRAYRFHITIGRLDLR